MKNGGKGLASTGDRDASAEALARRIGGSASVYLDHFGNREFDVVSERYVAQTSGAVSAREKPANFLNPARRRQIRETLRAAGLTGREALFEFVGGEPAPQVRHFIERNAARTGVGVRIDVRYDEDT